MRSGNKVMKFPGLADVHVHLRVPGGEQKEDYRTGSAAALAGGFTTLMTMPNTNPSVTTADGWRAAQKQANDDSSCDVVIFMGVSMASIENLPVLGKVAPALKLYMDLTYGDLRIEGLENLERIAELWPRDKVLALHAEGESVRIGLELAEKFNRRMHFCHISRKAEIEWIAEAKGRGLPVTCEVTPHHLFLTYADAVRLGSLGDMRPCLASQSDMEALWSHINTTVDCIASDHAPHTLAEKKVSQNPPPGVPGLESTLPLLLNAAAEGRISYDRIIALLSTNPRRIYSLPVQPDTWVEIDTDESYEFPDHQLYTKCAWSPFSGTHVKGKILRVVLRGREVVSNGMVHDFVR